MMAMAMLVVKMSIPHGLVPQYKYTSHSYSTGTRQSSGLIENVGN